MLATDWMAIIQGKGVLVEGAIIGSFLGTLLLLPGLSMVAGGVGRWKEQRFNVKSAGVSTVLLIMAMIGAFTPTLFYQTFGKHELYCDACPGLEPAANNDNHSAGGLSTALLRCTGCTYELPKNTGTDPFYISRTRPLMYICAAILPTAYLVGLWFTLRTHVRQIYAADNTKKTASMLLFASPPVSANTVPNALVGGDDGAPAKQGTPMRTPHQSAGESGSPAVLTPRTSAVPSTTRLSGHQPATRLGSPGQRQSPTHAVPRRRAVASQDVLSEHGSDGGHGGHDAPEWSKWKSSVILLLSTVLFSLLAELLVDTVDEVIAQSGLDKKFIGLTLFALVPNVTGRLIEADGCRVIMGRSVTLPCSPPPYRIHECDCVCDERQCRTLSGNWFRVRGPGGTHSDSVSCAVQRLVEPLLGRARYD